LRAAGMSAAARGREADLSEQARNFLSKGGTRSKHAKRHGASAPRRKCGVTPPGGFADQRLSIKRGPRKIADFVGRTARWFPPCALFRWAPLKGFE